MSVARMVTFVRSGLSTRVNCGVSAEVACTTLDRSTVTAVFGVVVRQTGSMFAAKGVRWMDGEVHGCLGEVPAVGDLQPHRCTAFAHRTGVEHEFAVRVCGYRRLVGVLHAPTRVSGSPSGSTKPPSAFMVYVAPCSTSVSSGCSLGLVCGSGRRQSSASRSPFRIVRAHRRSHR